MLNSKNINDRIPLLKYKTCFTYTIIINLATFFLLSVISCSKNKIKSPPPSIISLFPDNGTAGTNVTIKGEHFGDTKDNVIVTFGSKLASIIKFESNELIVEAPVGFNKSAAGVKVSVRGVASNEKLFTYEGHSPQINKIIPERGKPGDIISISGSGFGVDRSELEVQIETERFVKIISLVDTLIKIELPQGFSDQTVRIRTVISDLSSNDIKFYYEDNLPPIIINTTRTCFYGSKVILSGNNFSKIREGNSVKFGTKKAVVISATKTSLTVITPDIGDADMVDVTVSKHDMVSDPYSILVDYDQNKVATYDWATDTLRSGLIYKTGELDLFGNVLRRVYILDVTLNSTNTLGIGFSTNNVATVAMCEEYDAIAGINGGYFPLGNTVAKDPYIRINGVTVQEGDLDVSPIFTNSALIVQENIATVRKFKQSGRNLNQVAAAIPIAEAEDVIVCGPMLVADGKIEDLDMSNGHNSSQTARTGLGVTDAGRHIFMVVVDTNGGVTGVSTLQLAKIMQALGSFNAMNFDGGGSSTMYVNGFGDNGRVNFPNGGITQRKVSSILYLK